MVTPTLCCSRSLFVDFVTLWFKALLSSKITGRCVFWSRLYIFYFSPSSQVFFFYRLPHNRMAIKGSLGELYHYHPYFSHKGFTSFSNTSLIGAMKLYSYNMTQYLKHVTAWVNVWLFELKPRRLVHKLMFNCVQGLKVVHVWLCLHLSLVSLGLLQGDGRSDACTEL